MRHDRPLNDTDIRTAGAMLRGVFCLGVRVVVGTGVQTLRRTSRLPNIKGAAVL